MHQIQQIEYCCQSSERCAQPRQRGSCGRRPEEEQPSSARSVPIPGIQCKNSSGCVTRSLSIADWGVQKGIHQICTHSSWRTARVEFACQSMTIPGKCQGASRTIYRDWGVQKGIHQICTHSSWRTARVLLVWRCWSSRKIGWLLLHLQQETQCCSGHWCLLRWTLVQKHQLWEHKLSQVGQLLHWPWWVFWFNISLGCQERYRGDVSSSCVLREHKGGGRLCQGSPWC